LVAPINRIGQTTRIGQSHPAQGNALDSNHRQAYFAFGEGTIRESQRHSIGWFFSGIFSGVGFDCETIVEGIDSLRVSIGFIA